MKWLQAVVQNGGNVYKHLQVAAKCKGSNERKTKSREKGWETTEGKKCRVSAWVSFSPHSVTTTFGTPRSRLAIVRGHREIPNHLQTHINQRMQGPEFGQHVSECSNSAETSTGATWDHQVASQPSQHPAGRRDSPSFRDCKSSACVPLEE